MSRLDLHLTLTEPSMAWMETQRLACEVHLLGGTVLRGDLHLQFRSERHDGPETPEDLFNRPEPFVPLSMADGVVFLGKSQVLAIAFDAGALAADAERESAARHVEVAVTLADGAAHEGRVSVELHPLRSRPLDFLNATDRFFTLRTAGPAWLVARDHVRLVRPRD